MRMPQRLRSYVLKGVGFTVNEIVLTRKFSGFHNLTYFCLISFSVFVRRVESLSHNSDVG